MDEKQQIQQMLEKHKAYLENNPKVDVALCTKGGGFFYEYNEEYEDYPVFVRFQTAQELEAIMEENIATDYCIALQDFVEDVEESLMSRDGCIRVDLREEISAMDRRILLRTFRTIYEQIESTHNKLLPLKDWVMDRANERED